MNGTAKPAQGHKYRFETLTGFFAQDEEGTREDYAYVGAPSVQLYRIGMTV